MKPHLIICILCLINFPFSVCDEQLGQPAQCCGQLPLHQDSQQALGQARPGPILSLSPLPPTPPTELEEQKYGTGTY